VSYGFDKKGFAYCKWLEGKKQRIKYFGRGDIALQKARRLDEEIKFSKGKLKVDGGLTVSQVCQQYTTQHHVEDSTADSDDYRLSSVILPVLGDIPVEGITTQHLNDYVLHRLKLGRKTRTVDRELDILRSAFNWAASQDPPLIIRNPLIKFKIAAGKDEQVPAPPNSEELSRILSFAPKHLSRAVIINYHTMCRPGGEITRITWSDVDFIANEIRIIGARKGGPAVRYVPMSPELRSMMEEWRAEDENGLATTKKKNPPKIHNLTVVHHRYKPVVSLKRTWKETKEKAQIGRRIRLYDLRHAGITVALKAGADLKAISELAGHSRPDTTLRKYQHVSRDQHVEAIGKIPSIPILHKPTLKKSKT
jgi:integrase